MGKKYIIELEDENYHQYSDSRPSDYLWRVKGFNALVFDEVGIRKLTPYTEPDLEHVRKEAYDKGYEDGFVDGHLKAEKSGQSFYEDGYKRGLSDAWECAKKIQDTGGNLNWWIHNTSASEAIEKIRQYEQEQEYRVGDEFENGTEKFVVLKMDGKEIDRYIDGDGKTYVMKVKYSVMRKTGRHFPEIAAVLEKMRGEKE